MITYSQDTSTDPATLKQMFLLAFGCYPVLEWSENWTMTEDYSGELYDEPVVLRDFHLSIDTEQVDKMDDFGYSYVSHLLIKVVQDKLRKPDIKHSYMSASKKYCFSDTEDWWEAITFKGDLGSRTVFDVDVTIG